DVRLRSARQLGRPRRPRAEPVLSATRPGRRDADAPPLRERALAAGEFAQTTGERRGGVLRPEHEAHDRSERRRAGGTDDEETRNRRLEAGVEARCTALEGDRGEQRRLENVELREVNSKAGRGDEAVGAQRARAAVARDLEDDPVAVDARRADLAAKPHVDPVDDALA